MATATLIPTQMEVGCTRHGKPSYRWVPALKVITPDGKEIQPYMRIREARAFCKAQGWQWVEA